jgi:hypothetical protein
MCASGNTTSTLLCSSTFSKSPGNLATVLLIPETLTQHALNTQRRLFPPFLVAAAMIFTIGPISFSLLRMRSRPQAGKPGGQAKWTDRLTRATYGLLWLSTGVTLAVAYSTTLTLSSLQLIDGLGLAAQAPVQISRGRALEVVQWLVFSLSILVTAGATRLIRPLSQTTGDSGGSEDIPPPPPPQ